MTYPKNKIDYQISTSFPDSNFSLQQACHKFVMTRMQVCHKFVMTRVQACSKFLQLIQSKHRKLKYSAMFRRKPTRIELKVEDLQEYEAMKKQIEQKNSGDDKIEVNPGTADGLEGTKLRISMINERLGYKPQPRVSN
ncbi:hypothetical protein AVEN_142064-1 [Araneus ventricosus]|uniref:Anaphase-promoting complex subunit CDC26 n=1 Tax=Araneus ventricosus TaxID=182803 RepID=A0A4Y2NKP1_ARAVE|nr:hypothetical protein AVEN_142064-1 [Araneus ventricosus]